MILSREGGARGVEQRLSGRLLFCLVPLLCACGGEEPDRNTGAAPDPVDYSEIVTAPPPPPPPPPIEPIVVVEQPRSSGGEFPAEAIVDMPDRPLAAAVVTADRRRSYEVQLDVTREMQIPGPPGEMVITIGNSGAIPTAPASMASASTRIPAASNWASVEPFVPATFTVTPAKVDCLRIDGSGSAVRFELVPGKSGTFTVSANVKLYNQPGCEGDFIPKTASRLDVNISVDYVGSAFEKIGQLADMLWENIVSFWGALLAAFFAALLLAMKGKFKRWFGGGE